MSSPAPGALTAAVADEARSVPGELLVLGAEAVMDAPGWSESSQSAMANASPAVHYREHAGKIALSRYRTRHPH
ncbi:MAG: hypothetical protein KTU85_04995 [Acidimicrobiia bacterium]|nr:hypothetical protein [Acidimicrobiia bacterium]